MIVRKVIKALEKDGWVLISQKGSHMKYKKDNIVCIVPNHKEIFPKALYRKL